MPVPRGTLFTPVGFDANGYPRAFSLLWGYTTLWVETVTLNNAPAGYNYLYSNYVPNGYVGVLNNASVYASSSTNSAVYFYINNGTTNYALSREPITTTHDVVHYKGWIPVPAGWRVAVVVGNTASGTQLVLTVIGFLMQI